MRNSLAAVLIVVLVVAAAGTTLAASWTKVGSSAFSITPSWLQDTNRIRFNSIVVDPAGNVYATANNGDNATYTYPAPSPPYLPPPTPTMAAVAPGAGGVTIFKPDASKIDIRISDFSDPTWSLFSWGPDVSYATYGGRSDSRYVGAIDKLVVGGDGKVYGLIHYLEIQWAYMTSRQNHRIVRINPNGTVEAIYAPARPYTSNGNGSGLRYYKASGTTPPITYSWADVANTIEGMTVGGDGNVYFTMNDNDGYWKYHYLWRYNTASGLVEEAPGNYTGDPPVPYNNGRQQDHRMFDIEWVGVDPFDATNQMFAIVFRQKTLDEEGNAVWYADWRVDPMGWETNRWMAIDPYGVPLPYESAPNCLSQPGYPTSWGRDWITAMAYDPVNEKLVVCGRGSGGTNIFTRWAGDTSTAAGLFESTEDLDYKIPKTPNERHANGNGIPWTNGGNYWISALAINSDQNRTWMAFTGEAGYNYEPTGTILSWDTGGLQYDGIGNEGVPEADAYTVGLTFTPIRDAAYALVCNKNTGVYSVYKRTLGMNISQIKLADPGSFAFIDEPKTVTYVTYASPEGSFFYIEEENRSAGIKVISDGSVFIQAGDRVFVRGTVDTIDGEAKIVASSVEVDPTPGSIDPVVVGVGKIGGLEIGLQPDTPALDTRNTSETMVPQTLNTTGLLVRVVGTVFGSLWWTGFYLDDGSPYGLWVEYLDQAVLDGAVVGITGISSVMVDPTYGPVRRVLAVLDCDLVVYKAP